MRLNWCIKSKLFMFLNIKFQLYEALKTVVWIFPLIALFIFLTGRVTILCRCQATYVWLRCSLPFATPGKLWMHHYCVIPKLQLDLWVWLSPLMSLLFYNQFSETVSLQFRVTTQNIFSPSFPCSMQGNNAHS